jgi:putative addiction module component (TIGR02574 family)
VSKLQSFGIDQLSVEDRLDLIEEIWDSLPESMTPAEVPDWHLAILAERVAAADARPNDGRPWREALADLGTKP